MLMTKGDREKLRAELAGKAMQGWLANSDMLSAVHDHDVTVTKFEEIVAKASVSLADALMAELGIKGED